MRTPTLIGEGVGLAHAVGTRLRLQFGIDGGDLSAFAATSELAFEGDPRESYRSERALKVGGVLRLREGEATWQRKTLASGPDGEGGREGHFVYGQPKSPQAGQLEDGRAAELAERLRSLRVE